MTFYEFNEPYCAIIGVSGDFSIEDAIDVYTGYVADSPKVPIIAEESTVLSNFIKAYEESGGDKDDAIKTFDGYKKSKGPVLFLVEGSLC